MRTHKSFEVTNRATITRFINLARQEKQRFLAYVVSPNGKQFKVDTDSYGLRAVRSIDTTKYPLDVVEFICYYNSMAYCIALIFDPVFVSRDSFINYVTNIYTESDYDGKVI